MKLAFLTALASLSLPALCSATFIVAWHDFDGTASTEAPDLIAPVGFVSGTMTKPTASVNTGGSQDGQYAILSIPVPPTVAGGDGYMRVNGGQTASFSFTNTSGIDLLLANVLFDLARIVGTGSSTTLALTAYVDSVFASDAGGGFATVLNTNPNWADVANNPDNQVIIPVGSTLTVDFAHAAGAAAGLDNVAFIFTAVPEPAHALGLAAMLACGTMLRSRRRNPVELAV